jgi:formimidoylglutamate deiminase
MTSLHANKALLPHGWADHVRLDIDCGRLAKVVRDASPAEADEHADLVIPGVANAHSHAFQRALVGRTEQRAPAGHDTFWTWRERMYALAAAMNPARLRRIAEQVYIEMLAAGYTSVAEFHYLHADPDGGEDAMFGAIRDAAAASGIRLTYVPVLYERAGFERAAPEGAQKLFAVDRGYFVAHVERVLEQAGGSLGIGVGAHSIRAVSQESLSAIAELAKTHALPFHIHAAEQQREVDQSLSYYHRRPVRWLLENAGVDERWCLVHATHMDTEEIEVLAESGAVACLCPSTEANLGDGLFPLHAFLEVGGRLAIGSDSHVSVNPFEELRWLEYGQRLATHTRNVAAFDDGHTGSGLFRRVLEGGAQACGNEPPGLVPGAAADLVCLYADDPMLVGHGDESRLDALVFSGYALPIDRVMVAGEWCVEGGRHRNHEDSRAAYAETVSEIANEGPAP